MNRFLSLLLGVFLIIIVAESVYYFHLSSSKSSQKAGSQSLPTPTPSEKKELNILYRAADDSEGRTVVYSNVYGWNGVGIQKKFPWIYMVGLFDRWEEVPGSKDRYLYLADPGTKKSLEKLRVVYEDNPLMPASVKTTRIMAEDLSKLLNDESEMKPLGTLTPEKQTTLETIIHKNDAVVAFFATDYPATKSPSDAEVVIRDKENTPLVFWLVLRRNDTSQLKNL